MGKGYAKDGCDGRPSSKPSEVLENFTDHGSINKTAATAWPDPPNLGKDGYGAKTPKLEGASSILSEGAVEIPKEGGSHSGRPS